MSFRTIDGLVRDKQGVHFPREFEVETTTKTAKKDKTQTVAQPRFPRLNAAVGSLKAKILNPKKQQRALNFATFLAIYPVVKLLLSIIAGAGLTLPPVAATLLIAAGTIFLLALVAKMVTRRRAPVATLAKIFFKEIAKFVAAPVTSTYIIGKAIQHRYEIRHKAGHKE